MADLMSKGSGLLFIDIFDTAVSIKKWSGRGRSYNTSPVEVSVSRNQFFKTLFCFAAFDNNFWVVKMSENSTNS